jgi:formylglycine-generating enzyme required for sulfatase activity
VKNILLSLLFTISSNFIIAQDSFVSYNQLIPGSALYFKMMPIPAGNFNIGGTEKNIQLSAFWMGAFEVTRDEFDVYLKDEKTSQNVVIDAITRPSPQYVDLTWGMGKEGGYPANSMSQFAALMYCKWLYNKTKIFYRLPTEAEWEYACKAGKKTIYYFGNDAMQLPQYAWFQKNSNNVYHKVGQKKPNAWGLYDMLGNLLEWTLDHYEIDAYEKSNTHDPLLPANHAKYPKVLRGGSFSDAGSLLINQQRFHSDPIWNRRDPQIPKSKWWLTEAKNVGFRIVRPVKQPSENEVNEFFKSYLNQ